MEERDDGDYGVELDRAERRMRLLEQRPLGSVEWWGFVSARFPEYEPTWALAWWTRYALDNGTWDTCLDIGHEFWCRFGEGSCHRKGAMTCNETDEEAAALDAAVEADRAAR